MSEERRPRPWPRRAQGARGRSRGLFRRSTLVAFLAVLGPGLITASADNDAQGITTYSIVGAKFGYELLWLTLIAGVALLVTQEIGARLGMVTGKGSRRADPRAVRRAHGRRR